MQVLVLAHSWGDNVFRNFLHWADNQKAGWTEEHIAHYANMAGPVLGVPKAVTALLSGGLTLSAQQRQDLTLAELASPAGAQDNRRIPCPTSPAPLAGEMRDTAELGMLAGAMANHWIPRPTRANLFRTWGSLHGMLPVGGPAIWGNGTWAPDDDE